MAVFKILASRTGQLPKCVEFDVAPVSGDLQVGDVFFCFDLHHPIEFVVREVHHATGLTRVLCDGELGFPNQFCGAAVDSAATCRPYAFRYET